MAPVQRTPPPSTSNTLKQTHQCKLCKNPDDEYMVLCDGPCKLWFHLICVNLTEEKAQAMDKWHCNQCKGNVNANIQQNQTNSNLRNSGSINLQSQNTEHPTSPSRSVRSKTCSQNSQARRERIERKEELLRQERDILRREKLLHEKEMQLMEEKDKLSDEESLKSCPLILSSYQDQNRPLCSKSIDCNVQDNGFREKTVHHQNQIQHNENFQSVKQINSHQIPEATTHQMLTRHSLGKELPVFSGRPEEWAIFISAFNHSTNAMGFTNYENLIRLQKSLKGKAREIVESQLSLPNCVPKIIETLRMVFGRPEIVMHSQIEKIRVCQPVKADKLESIVEFSTAIQNLCATLEATSLFEYDYNPLFMIELVDKLPPNLKLEWAKHSENLNKPGITSFGEWLQEVANYVWRVLPVKNIASINSNKLNHIIRNLISLKEK